MTRNEALRIVCEWNERSDEIVSEESTGRLLLGDISERDRDHAVALLEETESHARTYKRERALLTTIDGLVQALEKSASGLADDYGFVDAKPMVSHLVEGGFLAQEDADAAYRHLREACECTPTTKQ